MILPAALRTAWLLLLFPLNTLANTEKTIFLGPAPLDIPSSNPTLTDLRLPVLAPEPHYARTVRTYLRAEFAVARKEGGRAAEAVDEEEAEDEEGYASWVLVHGLSEGTRYEVRVCWAATQPTSFELTTFAVPDVLSTPALLQSLAAYTATRQAGTKFPGTGHANSAGSTNPDVENPLTSSPSSLLLLRIRTTADYYTANATLMSNDHVPPVHVDLILDPYFLNLVPASLLTSILYVVVLAVGGWVIAGWVVGHLTRVARNVESENKREKKEQ